MSARLIRKQKGVRFGQIIIHYFMIFWCLLIILPVLLTLVVSFSSEESVMKKGFTFFPDTLSLDAYRYVFHDNDVFRAYGVTIFVTVVGTFLSVFICSLAGYVLANPKVKHRNKIALFFYIPTVLGSGLVPWYYNIAYTLDIDNTIWVLILPSLINVFNIFLIRNYYKSIPKSLIEQAEIDGASPLTIFFRIMLPLSLPITATVTLFTSLGYWNDWYLAAWFIDPANTKLQPLQYMLHTLWRKLTSEGSLDFVPTETVYVATMFITMGPIILVYPFVQKYFIKGIMIGGVKG